MKIFISLTLIVLLSACIQQPTQVTTVIDDRPRITFATDLAPPLDRYTVVIDGITYGSISQYLANEHALRIISGKHTIDIIAHGSVIKTFNVVLGAHETRTLRVPSGD